MTIARRPASPRPAGQRPRCPSQCGWPTASAARAQATIAEVLEANQRLFNEERDKLERWADDKLLAAEEALRTPRRASPS
jgi:hypothetical protein